MELAWLEDWTVPGGLSAFAFENDGMPVWFELIPNKDDATVGATGNAYAASGGMGGTFGDGSAAATSASWPLLATPVIDYPAPVLADA